MCNTITWPQYSTTSVRTFWRIWEAGLQQLISILFKENSTMWCSTFKKMKGKFVVFDNHIKVIERWKTLFVDTHDSHFSATVCLYPVNLQQLSHTWVHVYIYCTYYNGFHIHMYSVYNIMRRSSTLRSQHPPTNILHY